MFDKIAELLIETEASYFAARTRHQNERNHETRRLLKEATERLDDAKAEAERVLWASAA